MLVSTVLTGNVSALRISFWIGPPTAAVSGDHRDSISQWWGLAAFLHLLSLGAWYYYSLLITSDLSESHWHFLR